MWTSRKYECATITLTLFSLLWGTRPAMSEPDEREASSGFFDVAAFTVARASTESTGGLVVVFLRRGLYGDMSSFAATGPDAYIAMCTSECLSSVMDGPQVSTSDDGEVHLVGNVDSLGSVDLLWTPNEGPASLSSGFCEVKSSTGLHIAVDYEAVAIPVAASPGGHWEGDVTGTMGDWTLSEVQPGCAETFRYSMGAIRTAIERGTGP